MVRLTYFEDKSDNGLGSFADDLVTSIDAANVAQDRDAARHLRSIILDYFERTLGCGTDRWVERHLAEIAVWRRTKFWHVYRVPDTPSVAFAAKVGGDETVHLMVVAACYQYPLGSSTV